jgi:dihydropteroate synthase
VYGLPLYVALPWRETADHALLLEMVLDAGVEYGRAHYPDRVLAAAARRS